MEIMEFQKDEDDSLESEEAIDSIATMIECSILGYYLRFSDGEVVLDEVMKAMIIVIASCLQGIDDTAEKAQIVERFAQHLRSACDAKPN